MVSPGAAKSGTVLLGYVHIPLNESTATVYVSGLVGYNMKKGWQSAYITPLKAKIK